MKSTHVLTLLLVAGLATPALANDAEYGSFSGNPAPVKNDKIRMVSEDINFYQRSSGDWKVTALYVFENTTDTPVNLIMGFPEFQEDNEDFLKFETLVRGKKVKLRTANSAEEKNLGGLKELGRVHLFEVNFEPREKLNVVHTYDYRGGGSVAIAIEKTIQYVTRTGALWKGPIGRATFRIRTTDVYELIALPEEFEVKSVRRFVIRKGDATGMEIVLSQKNWKPKGDLDLDLVIDEDSAIRYQKIGGSCPTFDLKEDKSWSDLKDATPAEKPEMFEIGNLDKYDAERLRLCRNWIYARYGYEFKDSKLNEQFYGKVHVGEYPPQYDLHLPEEYDEPFMRKMIPLMPDPAFDPDMLSTVEMRYVELLREREKALREAR